MSNDETNIEAKRILRSPAYPNIGLAKAVDFIDQIYKQDRQMPTSPDVAMTHIGYKSAHGVAHRTLAALKSFGLLEEVAENVRVSDLAMKILLPHSSSEKAAALLQALLRPKIYAELIEYFGGNLATLELPSTESLRSYLVRSKAFNPNSVESFIEDFRESIGLVQNLLPSSVDGDANEQSEQPCSETKTNKDNASIESRKEISMSGALKIPIRLPQGRVAILILPEVFYESDKERIINQINVIYAENEEDMKK